MYKMILIQTPTRADSTVTLLQNIFSKWSLLIEEIYFHLRIHEIYMSHEI